jgi:hypothetical protein
MSRYTRRNCDASSVTVNVEHGSNIKWSNEYQSIKLKQALFLKLRIGTQYYMLSNYDPRNYYRLGNLLVDEKRNKKFQENFRNVKNFVFLILHSDLIARTRIRVHQLDKFCSGYGTHPKWEVDDECS